MTVSRIVLLALAACSGREVDGTLATHAVPPSRDGARGGAAAVARGNEASASLARDSDAIVKGVPHGGAIVEVAVTEQGDAALTVDSLGGARLWPALDGSKTPVPVSLVAVQQLALAHAGGDLLAAALDQAGSIDLVRLGHDGLVRGHVQLPGTGYRQIAMLDDGVLARSDDHALEWFAADGASRGKVVAEPSRHILAIAVRRGRGVAVVSDGKQHELRWLHAIGGVLSWRPGLALPVTVQEGQIALSPSHRRLAVVDVAAAASVYELGMAAVRVGSAVPAHDASSVGFIDEDHVAIIGSSLQWWVMPSKDDPWAVPAGSRSMPVMANPHQTAGGAVADGVAFTGHGAALALTDRNRVRYLGYRQHGAGNIGVAARSLWVSITGSHVMWLDDRLSFLREIELRKEPSAPWLHAVPIGDHHVVTQAPNAGLYTVKLIDVNKPDAPVVLGNFKHVERIDFAPESSLLAVSMFGTMRRFELDLATSSMRELAPIKRTGSLAYVRLLDPARTGGAIAITVGWDREEDDDQVLTIHRANGKRTKVKRFDATVIDVASDGTLYAWNGEGLQRWRGGKKVASITRKNMAAPVAVAPGGERLAIREGNDVVVLDREGIEQWRKLVWGTVQLAFTRDGKHLAVRAAGGIAMLAADTGEREAVECGWSFELATTPPASNPAVTASVCEDPIL